MTGLVSVHYRMLLCIVCVTCLRIIVLYSRYRVNRGTKMSVIFDYVILLLFFLLLHVGSVLGVYQPMGRSPPCSPLHNKGVNV